MGNVTKDAWSLPEGVRSISTLLSKEYTYVHRIEWAEAIACVWTAKILCKDIDPAWEGNHVAGYVVRYEREETRTYKLNGKPDREVSRRVTRIAKKAFPTQAKAIAYGLEKIAGNAAPVERDDSEAIGSPADRAIVDRAYLEDLRVGDLTFPRWRQARPRLPGG